MKKITSRVVSLGLGKQLAIVTCITSSMVLAAVVAQDGERKQETVGERHINQSV